MAEWISWAATVATVTGAFMTASNLGSRVTGYGFAVFTIGSLSWLAVGLLTDQRALFWTNLVLTGLNLFGIWRWLGRQAKIEEGASAGAQASESTPGESLFPVSLLLKAEIRDPSGEPLGGCVDAMAGCGSGVIRYVVASEGGVAGVGETLRRVPWERASVDGETVTTELRTKDFANLPEIARDRWPAR
jgi:hypothetical protein